MNLVKSGPQDREIVAIVQPLTHERALGSSMKEIGPESRLFAAMDRKAPVLVQEPQVCEVSSGWV